MRDQDSESYRQFVMHFCASLGGVYVGPLVAKHAKAAGFVEGVHYHIQRPIPTDPGIFRKRDVLETRGHAR